MARRDAIEAARAGDETPKCRNAETPKRGGVFDMRGAVIAGCACGGLYALTVGDRSGWAGELGMRFADMRLKAALPGVRSSGSRDDADVRGMRSSKMSVDAAEHGVRESKTWIGAGVRAVRLFATRVKSVAPGHLLI